MHGPDVQVWEGPLIKGNPLVRITRHLVLPHREQRLWQQMTYVELIISKTEVRIEN